MADRRDLRLVGLLFAFCLVFEVRFTVESIREQLHATEQAQIPFSIKTPGATIYRLEPEAIAAGIKKGDLPVSINGKSAKGMAGVSAAVRHLRKGDVIEVTSLHDGSPVSTHITLAAERATPLTTQDWILAAILVYLTPWFCILLGFGVVALRPRDPLAWLLLLLMLSFSQIAQGGAFASLAAGWDDWMRPIAIFFQTLTAGTWPVWMVLFGQYFPDRVANSIWAQLARWFLALPLALIALTGAIVNVVAVDDAAALNGVQNLLTKLATPLLLFMMVAISTFFINIFMKASSAKTTDERRRLKLLYVGTTASLTPLFLVVIAQLILRRPLGLTDWYVFPALLALFLFPMTLAYVIVVEKAMGLGVAVRQGLQYTLARGGVRVLMAIVIISIVLFAVSLLNQPDVRPVKQFTIIGFLIAIAIRLRQFADKLRSWIDRRFFREAVNTERVLRELGDNVRQIVETQPLLETVTSTISSALHVPRVAVMMLQDGFFTPAHALGYGASGLHLQFQRSSPIAEKLGKSHEPVRVSLARNESWVDSQLNELGTELLLPLSVKDRLLGFVSLGPKISEEPYTPTDVALLESVASQTGLALENSRLTEAVASEVAQRERLSRELEIAREVQQRLFPQSGPQIAGLDYAGKCRPASSVGGDYYDFVEMGDGRLGIAIGDISGKGIPAALLMASLQASLRGLAIANPPELSRLMGNLNRLIYDASPSNRYATFFYGVYNATSREFMYVNGGHNPPMIFRGNDVLRLEEGGPVVGLFGPAQYSQGVVFLEPGDTMVLFTDGVSEAMNNEEEEFDEARLVGSVRSGAGLNPSELIDHVMVDCDAFAAGAPQHDDMTLVVVKVE
jgi:phosphoserine phosphatase RsbU/P